MTIEENVEQIMADKVSVDVVDESRSELPQNKGVINISKEVSVRSKMEAMQKRIDELKEKVKYEGEMLFSKDTSIGQDVIDSSRSSDSLSDIKSKDSLSQDSNSFEIKVQEHEYPSDKSLYFSASSYSMSSVSSRSSDSTYCSFTKFVNNYMKNQDHKERLSLLQLHSKKQISLNMMKTSLAELESRCSEELELIERSLKHLNKLAEEFKVDNDQSDGDVNKVKALDFHSGGDGEARGQISYMRPLLKWLPLTQGSKTKVEVSQALEQLN